MQVILMEKVINLGQLGDVVKVKNGFGRNFLIPQGKAKRATESNIADFATRRAELEAGEAAKLADAQARGAKLEGATVGIVQKAGVDGKLFGSVTNADIATALVAQGHQVEKGQVRTPTGHLKQIGEHAITVALHSDVVVNVTVSISAE
ncbi:MAG: 50S ribosomal protein L9 [Sideroxydans sp.]|nr:50S ribosomal protein L9 [Sideroxydans sp.]NOT99590.1 50S ribosomal protein L9 [Sideroxydans sp.]